MKSNDGISVDHAKKTRLDKGRPLLAPLTLIQLNDLGQELLVEQELAQTRGLGHHLAQGRDLAGQVTHTAVLLLQELAGQVVAQVVVAAFVTSFNNVLDACSYLLLLFQSSIKSSQSILPSYNTDLLL